MLELDYRVIGFLFIMIAYPWGVMHSEAAHLIANEKLIGEFIGVAIAILAIGVLARLRRTDRPALEGLGP